MVIASAGAPIPRADVAVIGGGIAGLIAAPWRARGAWWRFARRRLPFPADARSHVDVVVEQRPEPASRVRPSDARDANGVPIPRLDGRSADEEHARLIRAASDQPATDESIFHPVGSTRIGADPSRGVVDRDLVVHGLPNVTVLSTSAFPTGGGADPTMMLVLAALRAAERLSTLKEQ